MKYLLIMLLWVTLVAARSPAECGLVEIEDFNPASRAVVSGEPVEDLCTGTSSDGRGVNPCLWVNYYYNFITDIIAEGWEVELTYPANRVAQIRATNDNQTMLFTYQESLDFDFEIVQSDLDGVTHTRTRALAFSFLVLPCCYLTD